jgi:hypothetical protein
MRARGHQPDRPAQLRQQPEHFLAREDDRQPRGALSSHHATQFGCGITAAGIVVDLETSGPRPGKQSSLPAVGARRETD